MRPDSQDVGLEAAIIERVRNSSLVECVRTDNVARLKHRTEAVDIQSPLIGGRRMGMVGERCARREAGPQGLVERAQERMPE